MSLIDLDQPADRATGGEPRPLSRRGAAGVAVVALLVGAVFGGLVTHRWTVQRARVTDERKVSLLLFPGQQAGGDAVDSVANGDGSIQMTFDAAVAVVNAGPLPVELRSLAAQAAGMTVAGTARAQSISPGTSVLVDVVVTVDCVFQKADGGVRVTVGGGITQATASVLTSGGSTATVASLSLDTGPWVSKFQTAAEKCLRTQM